MTAVPHGAPATAGVRSAEYDAFGPWIDEICTPDDVPRLFRDFPLDLPVHRLVLKVPRNIARRDATPDMDLYDHLLAVGPAGMTVLTRSPGGYTQATVPYDQITAFEDSVDLLDGRLTVHTLAADPLSVPYNGAAHEVVATLVRVLRGLTVAAASPTSAASTPPFPTSGVTASGASASGVTASGASASGVSAQALPDLGLRDRALATFYRDVLRGEPGLRVLAAHGRLVRTPRGGPLSRAVHLARPMTLQGAIVATDGLELQVLGRRDQLIRGNRTVHSLARLVVPMSRIHSATVTDHPRYSGVRVVTLHAGSTLLAIPVPAGSDAERVLLECSTG